MALYIPSLPRNLLSTDPMLYDWLYKVYRKLEEVEALAWDLIDTTGSSIVDLEFHSHTLLDDIGTNTHDQIDTHINDLTKHFTLANGLNMAAVYGAGVWTLATVAIPTFDAVQFNLTPTVTAAEGQLYWNEDDGTLNLGMPGGKVNLQFGQEMLVPRRVRNDSGVDMKNGNLVYISDVQGQRAVMSLAKADAEVTSSTVIAMLTEDIDDGAIGWATTTGLVRGEAAQPIDTSSFTIGDILWLSPSVGGGFTNVKPTAPNHAVMIGHVWNVHASEGEIYLRIIPGWEIEELHDVLITSVADKQALIYEAASALWKNINLTGDYISGFTSGSVLFADTDGTITEDNTNLKWDNINNYFGLGGIPAQPCHIWGTAAGVVKTLLTVQNTSSAAGAGAAIDFGMTTFSPGRNASISAVRTNRGASGDTDFRFSVVTGGVFTEKFRIRDDGKFGFNTTSLSEVMNVNGNLHFITNSQKAIFGTGKDVEMYYDGTTFKLVTDVVAAGDFDLDCGTQKTLRLVEEVWDDLQFQISSGRVGVANFPDWDTAFTTNTGEYKFDVNDYIDLASNEPSHGWAEGTDGSVHIHVALDGGNVSGSPYYAKFTVYLGYADVEEVWTETPLTAELTIPDGTADRTHLKLYMGAFTLTNNLIGTQMKARLTRIAATSGTEYPNHIFVNQLGIHLEHDTIGSRQSTTK